MDLQREEKVVNILPPPSPGRLTGFKASVYETEDSVFKSQSGDYYDDYSNNFNNKLGIYLVKSRRVIYGRLYRKW